MPITNTVTNEDGSFTVTITVPAPTPVTPPTQVIDIAVGETIEIVAK